MLSWVDLNLETSLILSVVSESEVSSVAASDIDELRLVFD